MENPYQTPIYALGLLAGIVAGLIPGNHPVRWLNRLYVMLSASCGCWLLFMLYTDWAYTHPFDPNDGGPRVFSALLGWAAALAYPIVPAFFLVSLVRLIYGRHKAQGAT